MRRARTLSEFHYNRVFIDATALTSEARLHAELRFKLGFPSDYAANWDALVNCLSSIGDPDAHLCRYWECTPTKRLVLSVRGFSSPDIDPTLLMSLAAAVASANDRLRDDAVENKVLLGAKPHGAVDETAKQRQQQEAERLARRTRVAEAGGQLLTAAFTFLGEMIPQREPTDGAVRMAREFKARLDECLERDDRGRPRLTVTLPDGNRARQSRPLIGRVARLKTQFQCDR